MAIARTSTALSPSLVLFLVLFSVISDCAADGSVTWEPFRSEAGRFTVKMPGQPKRETTHTKSFIGTITNHIFVGTERHDTYTVEYSDLPGFAVAFAGDGTIFSHAKGALLKKTLGKEKSYGKATLKGMKGVHLVYETPPVESHPRMRGEAYMFLIGDRLYVIDATVALQHSLEKAREFFDSLEIGTE